MKDEQKSYNDVDKLRRLAEEHLQRAESGEAPFEVSTEIQKLLHELRVHQIELEVQNEELRLAQIEAEAAVDRYTDLYDSAPVAYFTLDREGVIRKANLAGAKLLKVPVSNLVNRRLAFFISPETLPSFNAYISRVFDSHVREKSKTDIVTGAGNILCVHMDAVISRNDEECHVTITEDLDRKIYEDT